MLPPEHGVAPIDEEVMTAVADFAGPPVELTAHAVGNSTAQAEEAPPVQAPSPVAPPVHAEAPAPRARPPAAAPAAPEPAPAAPPPAAPSAGGPPPAKEPPRRRSTVREPVRFPVGEASMPAPAPVAAEPAVLHRPAPEPAPAEAAAESGAGAPRRAGLVGETHLRGEGVSRAPATGAVTAPIMSTAYALFDTAIGGCAIAWSGTAIVTLQLPEADDARTRARVLRRWPRAQEQPPPPGIQRTADAVAALLSGAVADLAAVGLNMERYPRSIAGSMRSRAP